MRARFRAAAPRRLRRATLMAGAWLGGRRAPFAPVWNRDLFTEVRRLVDIPVFAVGGIRTAAEAREHRRRRARPTWWASVVRSTPSPTSPAASSGPATPTCACRNANRCVSAQMLGMKGVCYTPEVRRVAAELRRQPTPV